MRYNQILKSFSESKLALKVKAIYSNKFLPLKTQQKILIVGLPVFIIVAIFVIVFASSPEKKEVPVFSEDFNIEEPDAPQSIEFSVDSLINLFKSKDEVIADEVISAPGIISDNTKLILDAENVSLSKNSEYILIEQKDNDSSQGYNKIDVVKPDGQLLAPPTTEKVIRSKFIDGNKIFYQTLTGIYIYNPATAQNILVVETTDPQAFNNIAPIDDTKYFFIQPTTGKVGYGFYDKSPDLIIGEKLLPTNGQYVKVGAYSFADISPNKEYIALLDKSPTENGDVTLIVLRSGAENLGTPHYSTEVALSPSRSLNQNLYQWSEDGRYLLMGDNSTLSDLNNKNIQFQSESDFTNAKISPDSAHLALMDFSQNKGFIVDLSNNTKREIADFVSQIEWLNNNTVVLVIGKRLYTYSLLSNKLESVSPDEAEYLILSIDRQSSYAIVKKNNEKIIVKPN